MPKLYMGRPITISSAAQFGDQGVGEIDDRLLLGAALFGLGQKGHEAGAVQVGHGLAARSRSTTVPGWLACQAAAKRSASWLDWPWVENRLALILRRVVIWFSVWVGWLY
jgi:hypothetical protein